MQLKHIADIMCAIVNTEFHLWKPFAPTLFHLPLSEVIHSGSMALICQPPIPIPSLASPPCTFRGTSNTTGTSQKTFLGILQNPSTLHYGSLQDIRKSGSLHRLGDPPTPVSSVHNTLPSSSHPCVHCSPWDPFPHI